jgi:hypothetical protein
VSGCAGFSAGTGIVEAISGEGKIKTPFQNCEEKS